MSTDSTVTSEVPLGLALLVSVEEAATLLGIGRTTAYELVMRGHIQSVTVGRRRLVLRKGLSVTSTSSCGLTFFLHTHDRTANIVRFTASVSPNRSHS